jgi:NHL repeat-containing protein
VRVAALAATICVAPAAWSAVGQSVGTIATVAGNGSGQPGVDGQLATAVGINHPRGLAVLPDGSFLFAEPFANTVQRVAADGRIYRVAGTGSAGYSGDGGPAVLAQLDGVHGVAPRAGGGFVLADTANDVVRSVSPEGTITTIAGTGAAGFSGDGGPATKARLDAPRGIAALPDGGLLIPDSSNQRIRRVWPDGTITTVAGTGVPGFSGDGGPATAAQLDLPFGVAVLSGGAFLVADTANSRVRKVRADGTIVTVAGTGVAGFSGDGGSAVAAELNNPHAVVALPDGGFLVADTFNNRVRRVSPQGVITTVAGTGVAGFSGDGGPASVAALDLPKAVALLPDASGFLVADSANDRVRRVAVDLRAPLLLRLTPPKIRSSAGAKARLRYVVSERSQAVLSVKRGTRVVLRVSARAKAGTNALAFGRTLRAGAYGLVLRATTPDGRVARSSGALTVRR